MTQQQAQTRIETDQEKSCHEFVQGFYDWYFDRLNLDEKSRVEGPTFNDVIRFKPEILTARLRQLLKRDMEAQAKDHDYIVGLDSDPFINAQDWDGKYLVETVTLKGSNCRASVWGMDSGAKREIVDPELEFQSGKWVIINFHDPVSTDPHDQNNLIDVLLGLQRERDRSKK